MKLEPYITHTFTGLEGVNDSIKALHDGKEPLKFVRLKQINITALFSKSCQDLFKLS